MPRASVEYVPRPYVRPAYEPDNRTLMDLMRLANASRSESIGRQGAVRAQGFINLGNLISGALSSYRQDQDRDKALAIKQQEGDRDEAFRRDQLASVEADRVERRQMAEQAAKEKSQADAYRRGGQIADTVEYGPLDESQVDDVMAGPAAGRARYAFGPGTSEGPELMPSPSQQRGIQTEQAIKSMGGMIGPNGQVIMPPKVEAPPTPESRLSGEDLLAYLASQGNQGAIKALQVKRSQRPSLAPSEKNPIAVMGDDGQPVYMLPNQAVGRRPASNREQGRPVTSGDANRVADLNTSMDDLKVLTEVLSGVSGSTGTSAKVGAMLPNWVTELTGRGTSAKQKQATIDRVKQVIGKALEGGVLRKEDEQKYEKILPTIYDPPPIVTSKLQGLESALSQRKSVLVDALKDAGYDTAAYEARQGGKQADPLGIRK